MSEIDWSKAPEGAQYWRKSLQCWYMADGGRAHVFRASSGRWDRSTEFDARTIEESPDIVKRPSSAAWNGEGLPPVNARCEYIDSDGQWIKCEVVAHRNNAAVILDDHYECALVVSGELRPIRTPEQIAAEERERAVDALCYEIIMHYGYPKNAEAYRSLATKLP